MADQWFENAPMGQRARLLTLPGETGGRRFVLEYVNRPRTGRFAVPAHFHPAVTETFEVLSGRARYRVGADERTAETGAKLVFPPGVVHVHPWSDSDEELRVRQTAEADPPDLRGLLASLQAAITIFGLASAGRVNARGLPNPLQLAVLAETTIPATYLARAPRLLQRAGFTALAAVGRLAGLRAAYPEFGVLTPAGLHFGSERPGA